MRLFVILLVPAAVYFFMFRSSPVGPVVKTITEAPAIVPASGASTPSDFLKRPLDRTHEVLEQARTKANDPAF